MTSAISVVVDPEGVGPGEGSHEGGHPVAVDGDEVVQPAQHRDVRRADAHLLLRFPKGGGLQVGVFGVAAASGKGDLPAVVVEDFGAPGEEDVVVPVSEVQGEKDRGGPEGLVFDGAGGMGGQSLADWAGIEHQTLTETAFSRRAAMVAA